MHHSVLSDLKKGDKATITGFTTEEIPAKFYSIGIVPGTLIEVYRKIPLNGPICIILTNSEAMLAIRKSEAELVMVEESK